MPSHKRKPPLRRLVANAKWTYDAARDFTMGSVMLWKHFGGPLFPLRAAVTTHLFAIELYLKFLHAQDSGSAPDSHDIAELFQTLPEADRHAIASAYRGKRALLAVLDENRNAFVEWRYIYEQQKSAFRVDVEALRSLLEAVSSVSDHRVAE